MTNDREKKTQTTKILSVGVYVCVCVCEIIFSVIFS